MIQLPTSNNWWIFDDTNSRFRRISRDMDPDAFAFEHDWEQFASLEVDPDYSAFTVFLNEEKTRMLRAYIDEAELEDLNKDLISLYI